MFCLSTRKDSSLKTLLRKWCTDRKNFATKCQEIPKIRFFQKLSHFQIFKRMNQMSKTKIIGCRIETKFESPYKLKYQFAPPQCEKRYNLGIPFYFLFNS